MTLRALDLFCGGGGASVGLARAGFTVTGVDIRPQHNYPFSYVRCDVIDIPLQYLSRFDLIWASPPCQRFSRGSKQWGPTEERHPDLIPVTRDILEVSRRPYVIENVELAPLRSDLFLCGMMFGLRIIRHRRFEISGFDVPQPHHDPNQHHPLYRCVAGGGGRKRRNTGTGQFGRMNEASAAMGIDWMVRTRLTQAVPPAYAKYIGKFAARQMKGEFLAQ
jgi:DNA (cytosine-5)-methyltransferase 1